MADPQSNAAPPAYSANPLPHVPKEAPRAGVLHVRHRHTDWFTVVGNHLAQHPRLSAAAIGLGVYIQSLPDSASVTAKALTLRFPEGETTVRRALNELEAAGYLVRRRIPLGGGRAATRTFFYDKPGCLPESRKLGPEPGPVPGRGYKPEPETRPPAPTSPTATPPPPPAGSEPGAAPTVVPPQEEPPAAPPTPPQRTLPPRALPPHVPAPPPPELTGPAARLLARLRLADPRLLLSTRDVRHLLPAVDAWLSRSATSAQITRTLIANLPPDPVPIHHPARFLEHRLRTHLPPPLPAEARPPSPSSSPHPHSAPLVTCDGCDRAIRSHDPDARCADCRTAEPPCGRAVPAESPGPPVPAVA